jgi:hypothetical protein
MCPITRQFSAIRAFYCWQRLKVRIAGALHGVLTFC